MKNYKYELVLVIVNSGFEDQIMDAVKDRGAKGGTIISGRGTAREDAEEYFGLTIHPEKSILLILVAKTVKKDVLKAVYEQFGIMSEAQGVAFTLPVSEVSANISDQFEEEKESE